MITTQADGDAMASIAQLMSAGRLKMAVDRVFPLSDAVYARAVILLAE